MNTLISHKEIENILPQTHPFIMIDRVVAFEKGKSLTAIKNITGSEWVFKGMEYGSDVFPETLVIEAAAQAALILYQLSLSSTGIKPKVLLGQTKAEFQNFVRIGDQLTFTVKAVKMMLRLGIMSITVSTSHRPIANIEILYSRRGNDEGL